MYIGRPAFIEQLNDITFWYPILDRIGMRTPKTRLICAPRDIATILDLKPNDNFKKLVEDIKAARDSFGGTAFLRSGQTSNKHDWKRTCYLTPESNVADHVANLVNFCAMVDLPWETWAVREMIATIPITTAFDGDMPIAREVRLFADQGKLICAHPYWPEEAFKGSMYSDERVTDEQIKQLAEMPEDMTELTQMAEYVSKSFRFAWSIDFLQDTEGKWWLTDMALARTSYHWPDCPNKKKLADPQGGE